jgi:hypothetical protein
MQKVGQLPRSMIRVGLGSVYASEALADWSLSASYLNIIAVRGNKNVDKALWHTVSQSFRPSQV